jgi:hypothetical protein
MKKIYAYIVIFVTALAGCDVLDTVPTDRLSAEVYWQTDQDAEYAANAIYQYLEAPGTLLGRDEMSDIATATFETSAEIKVEQSIADAQTDIFQNTWNDLYRGIRRCNDYTANVERITPTDEAAVNRYTAEVRTLRCYFYARLASYFGDVPLLKNPVGISESKELTRTPVSEIYDFIYTEIADAVKYLPKTAAKGRVSKGAAFGILARAMLFAAGNVTGTDSRPAYYYEKAKAAADSVIALDVYNLTTPYAELFSYARESSPEVLFEKQFIRDDFSNAVFNNFGALSMGTGGSRMSPTLVLLDEYEMSNGKKITDGGSGYDEMSPYANRDPRLGYTLYYPGATLPNGSTYDSRPGAGADAVEGDYRASKTGLLPKKYINPEDLNFRSNCAINLIIIRYAEILLTAAEARIELNQELSTAQGYINQIRGRSDVSMPAITASSQSDLRDAVRHERMVELALEGNRFFDIRRWKIAETVCNVYAPMKGMRYVANGASEPSLYTFNRNKIFKDRDYLWPVPYNERQLSPELSQNEGWN